MLPSLFLNALWCQSKRPYRCNDVSIFGNTCRWFLRVLFFPNICPPLPPPPLGGVLPGSRNVMCWQMSRSFAGLVRTFFQASFRSLPAQKRVTTEAEMLQTKAYFFLHAYAVVFAACLARCFAIVAVPLAVLAASSHFHSMHGWAIRSITLEVMMLYGM